MTDASICLHCGKKKNPSLRKCPHCGLDQVEKQGEQLRQQIIEKRAAAGSAEGGPTQDSGVVKPVPSEKTNSYAPALAQEQDYYSQKVCAKCGTIIGPGSSMCPIHGRYGGTTVRKIPFNRDETNNIESNKIQVNYHKDIHDQKPNGTLGKTSPLLSPSNMTANQDQPLANNSATIGTPGIPVPQGEDDKLSIKSVLPQSKSNKGPGVSSSFITETMHAIDDIIQFLTKRHKLLIFISMLIIVFIGISIFGRGLLDWHDQIANNTGQSSNDTPIISNQPTNGMPLVSGNITDSDMPQVGTNVITDNGSPVGSLPTLIQKDITPPERTSGPIPTVTGRSATIEWSTNEPAKSKVKYGLTQSCEFPSIATSSYSNNQHIFIDGLSSGTTYYYQLISIDESNNIMVSKSGDFLFTTELSNKESPYVGNPAPEFKLKTLDGAEVSLSQLRGKKVILNFWADWCSACKVEMPHLQLISDKLHDNGVVVLTIATGDSDIKKLNAIVKDSGYTFKVALDSNDHVLNIYSITSLPVTYFIDASGVIRKYQRGMFTGPGEIEFMLNSY